MRTGGRAARRVPRARSGPHEATEERPGVVVELPALVDGWVAEGLITPEQARRLRERTTGATLVDLRRPGVPPGHPPGASLLVEALGYLGGVLVVVAAALLTGQVWDELGLAWRTALVGGVAALLLAAGAAVPGRLGAPGRRMRAVLWALSVAATAALLVLLGAEGLTWPEDDVALLAGCGAAVQASLLWRRLRTAVQQLALFAPLVAVAGAAAAHLPDDRAPTTAVAVWGLGVVWALLGWAEVVAPRWAALVLGAVAAQVAAGSTYEEAWGPGLAALTVVAVVSAAVAVRDLRLMAAGVVGALVLLPGAVTTWFPGAVGPPVVLLLTGTALVAVAVWTARAGRAGRAAGARRPPSRAVALRRGPALVVAGAVAASTTAAVLLLGLT